MSFDMNKMLEQVQQMQSQMAEVQQELANERVEASAGGGVVTVTASGAGEIVAIKISPEAIDPEDPGTARGHDSRRRERGPFARLRRSQSRSSAAPRGSATSAASACRACDTRVSTRIALARRGPAR